MYTVRADSEQAGQDRRGLERTGRVWREDAGTDGRERDGTDAE